MPAVKKVSEKSIIDCACAIVREGGMSALNARSLAGSLNCSTRPIYLSFGSMEGVKAEVVKRINAVYLGYLHREAESGKYPPYKSYGMAYIKFAREERQYFSYKFMRDRTGGEDADKEEYGEVIKSVMEGTGLNEQSARLFHLENWIFVHGIAVMLATSYITLGDELISGMLTDVFEGLKARFAAKK